MSQIRSPLTSLSFPLSFYFSLSLSLSLSFYLSPSNIFSLIKSNMNPLLPNPSLLPHFLSFFSLSFSLSLPLSLSLPFPHSIFISCPALYNKITFFPPLPSPNFLDVLCVFVRSGGFFYDKTLFHVFSVVFALGAKSLCRTNQVTN